jgi:hypothetical protein
LRSHQVAASTELAAYSSCPTFAWLEMFGFLDPKLSDLRLWQLLSSLPR